MAKYSRKQLAEMILSQTNQSKRRLVIKAVAKYLMESSRSKEIEVLIREISLQAQEQHGHVLARVTSAHKLSENQLSEIKKLIREYSKLDQVELSEMINPSLLGGLVINTPTSEADLSVNGRLKSLMN